MKVSIAFERASHVNSGTSVDGSELPWPETEGRVMRHPLLHLESDPRGEMTHYGGLVLAQQFVRRFGVAKRLDDGLMLFKRHAPYHESDHVLALAYTLYADGTCLEDQAALQGSEAVRRLVGACRIPDPTTAGDFLRRFKTAQDVEQLSEVIDRRGSGGGVVEAGSRGASSQEEGGVCAGRSRWAHQASLWGTEGRSRL